MDSQRGFTLIELVMVIVILGILAATAIPKFLDLSSEARVASLNGVVGALGSASAINYATRSANASKGAAIANCTNFSNTLEGGLPAGFTITNNALVVGTPEPCVVTDSVANTASFQGIAIN